jgi:hypothetical protein
MKYNANFIQLSIIVFPAGSGSLLVIAVVCSVLLFLVGSVGGFTAGTLVGYCCARKHHEKPNPPPPAPLYEAIDMDITIHRQAQQGLKLEDNVGYGHFK